MTIKEVTQITQKYLQEVYELERKVSEDRQHLDDLKSELKTLLLQKIPMEFGRFVARLVTVPGRNVPWKQIVIELRGEDYADTCKRRFRTYVHYEVKVEEHGIPPLWQNGANTSSPEFGK
jgi:hypothetical protein